MPGRYFLLQGKKELTSGIAEDMAQQKGCFDLWLVNAHFNKALNALKIYLFENHKKRSKAKGEKEKGKRKRVKIVSCAFILSPLALLIIA